MKHCKFSNEIDCNGMLTIYQLVQYFATIHRITLFHGEFYWYDLGNFDTWLMLNENTLANMGYFGYVHLFKQPTSGR